MSRWLGSALAWAAIALAALSAAFSAGSAVAASDVQLIMVDDPVCHYCRKWDAEIGGGYAASDEGRFAPLRRVRRGSAELGALAPVVYTPTFIVLQSGAEVGRVVGHPGANYFYGELRVVLAKAGFTPASP